jgi:hypothetical protein
MTVRYLLVRIDDEQPLGPQLAGARLWGIAFKLLSQLTGGTSVRHLQRLVEMSSFCDRQTVSWSVILPPQPVGEHSEGDVMGALFGGMQAQPAYQPAPTVPAPDDGAAKEAARKQRAADDASTGRSATILTNYAMATQQPSTLKQTLGGS